MENIKEIIKECTNKITLDNFIELHKYLKLMNNKEKIKKYKEDFKELIQLIINYLIFGDKKKDQTFFESFCELDFMNEFIIASKNKDIEILLQIIKSMSALILSISNKASIYYIFSNNFINNIITNDDIQESSEDFLSFYVNFLKSLSLKIDATTLQLFFQKEKNSFPLLENALKLYNNEDSMIKNVVRNIFLKFAGLSKEHEALREYLTSVPILKYFCFLSCRLTDMTIELNRLAGYNMLYKYNIQPLDFNYDNLKGLQDDLIDEILYINDVLSINNSQISFILLNSLLYYYICPLILGSIYNYKLICLDNANKKNIIRYIVAPEIAFHILTLFFSNINNDSLLNILCYFLFKPKINQDIIIKFINIHLNNNIPIYPHNYVFKYNEQSREKNISFNEYITYNFNKKFICSLIFKPNNKYNESIQIYKKYEKYFENPSFMPYNYYENIFKDICSKLSNDDKIFMRNYHNIISKATGVKSGLSENEFENNVLNNLNSENNMIDNPIKKIIFEDFFNCPFELIKMGINIMLYSMLYKILLDKNNNMNASLSRKFLYYECKILPFDLYLNKTIVNRTIIENNENEEKDDDIENHINDNDNKDNKKEDDSNNIVKSNSENKEIDEYNNMIFKTENYELKYNKEDDIYSNEFIIDHVMINNLIKLLTTSHPYCSLELLLNVYNIRYLLCPINIQDKNESTPKEICFTEEEKKYLISSIISFIRIIKKFLTDDISTKYISFELFENTWKTYENDYTFNDKNKIIKYILTPYYFCIPSATINVEDFPFQNNNNRFVFDTYLTGYLALNDLIYNKKTEKFPIENGIFEYKQGDKIKIEDIDAQNSKLKLIKILIKTRNRNEFEECYLFTNKNTIIIGNKENDQETGLIKIAIKFIHPLRELEICLDNEYPNSLQLYFKTNNYIIECESKDIRKEIKAELENKRNEYRKWEQTTIFNYFDEEEKKYKELIDNNGFKKENVFKIE